MTLTVFGFTITFSRAEAPQGMNWYPGAHNSTPDRIYEEVRNQAQRLQLIGWGGPAL